MSILVNADAPIRLLRRFDCCVITFAWVLRVAFIVVFYDGFCVEIKVSNSRTQNTLNNAFGLVLRMHLKYGEL
jgi:hypothetical protein